MTEDDISKLAMLGAEAMKAGQGFAVDMSTLTVDEFCNKHPHMKKLFVERPWENPDGTIDKDQIPKNIWETQELVILQLKSMMLDEDDDYGDSWTEMTMQGILEAMHWRLHKAIHSQDKSKVQHSIIKIMMFCVFVFAKTEKWDLYIEGKLK